MSIDQTLKTLALAVAITAPSFALAIPTFTASAGPGNNSSCGGVQAGTAGSLVPASASHVCANLRGTAAANATSTFGSVGADANAIRLGSDSVPLSDGSSAFFSDTLTFSKLDPDLPDQFTVSLNLRFAGVLNAAAAGGFAQAQALMTVEFLALRQLQLIHSSSGEFLVRNNGGFASAGTIAPGAAGFDSLLTTPAQLAAIGDVPFALRLDAIASANGSGASARSDFSNTLEFPSGTDVFNLPVGYTVNAGRYLVDNRFADPNVVSAVPEPGTWALLLFGFGVLSFVVRRRNKAS